MICLGPQKVARHRFDAEAAQLRIATSFRSDFLSRYPDGFVTSELEYQGGTTAAYAAPRPLRTPGKPYVNRALDAMASDFRNWCKERDYRKCDVLGISNDGHHAELLEVTSEQNAPAAIRQLQAKLSILRDTVSRIHHLSVDWQPSAWRPDTKTLFCPLTSTPDEIRYACYEPTLRQRAPRGVILYELHALPRKLAINPLPSGVQKSIRLLSRAAAPRTQSAARWAEQAAISDPAISPAVRALAAGGALALVIVAVAMLIDPVPGDELAPFAAASSLLRIARGY